MRFLPLIAAAMLLTACGGEDETHVVTAPIQQPEAPAPVTAEAGAPKRYYLSAFALVCPTKSAAEETLDYLRKVIGDGELRKNCTISERSGETEVLVDPDEVARLSQLQEPQDRVLAWKAYDSDYKGWSPMPFLATREGGFYPLVLPGAAPQGRVMAFDGLEDLRAIVALEPGTAEYNDREAALRKQQAFSRQNVDNRLLEVTALAEGADFLERHIMLARWRFEGQKSLHWSRLTDLFSVDSARAELADRLGGR